jgi:hypothetical protein
LTTKFTRHISKSLPQCFHCSLRLHIRLERLGILSSVSLLWNIEPGKIFVVADLLIARSEDRTPADPHSKKFITRLACIFTQSIQLSNIILGCLAAWPLLAAVDISSSPCARVKPLAVQCSKPSSQLSAISLQLCLVLNIEQQCSARF